jgi:uncharacterized damage-inducible protein DinB
MNSILNNYYPVFELYQSLRTRLLDILTDEDLFYRINDRTETLAELCRDIGETEMAYIDSFKTFKQDFSYRHEAITTIQQLGRWWARLDEELKTAISALTEEDIQNRTIYRGENFQVSPPINLTIYNEALLIFYGKVSVYLRAMGKRLPQQWQEWIG